MPFALTRIIKDVIIIVRNRLKDVGHSRFNNRKLEEKGQVKEMKETYEELMAHAEKMKSRALEEKSRKKGGQMMLLALRRTVWSENLEAFEAVAEIAREMGAPEEKIDGYRSSPLECDLFTQISRANKGGNKALCIRSLERAIAEEDTEAIGQAAEVAEKHGVSRDIIDLLILGAVTKWQEEKNYRLLVEAARDMFEYVKEYLNPEFVAEVEADR